MVMHVELQATCSALGYHEGNRYIKEPDCLETVKELIRFLRREDDTCDIRRQLGHAQILQKDLLQLVKQHHDDKPLFDTIIRLLVNLTQPVLVCFNNQLPEEKTLRQYCLEIESHLQLYKEAFVDEELFTVLTKKMTAYLELDWEHRHEEDKLNLERLLILVRNVVLIPPDPATEQRTDDDASLHDQVLWAIHVSGMEDLLLYIASSETERQLCMHILEIVSLMFREQAPEILAFAGVQRSMSEKEKDERLGKVKQMGTNLPMLAREKELEVARAKERAQKKSTMLRFNTRHSNFGGTYVMANTKSLSDRDLIYHKSQQDADNFTLDTNKKRRKKPKNRQPIKDAPVVRRSTLSIRLGLKEFCVQFLENAYNPLMYAVKDNLIRETTQELDETYYLWAMQFFMEFCRHHSGHVDFVSETLSVPTFHYIYNNLLRYYEMIMVEKKEAIVWGRRVHLALRAYQELLMTLDSMDKSNNAHLKDSARVIKSNVFYIMEFRDIFVTLLKKFNESKNSRTYLKDLVETTHLFLRMLEKFTKVNNHLVVQGKKRRKKKRKQAAAAKKSEQPSEQELEDIWQDVSSELSALLQGREDVPEGVAPFDAASEVDVDQQRVDAMVRIQMALRQKKGGEAVAILRAAREVWPEHNEFGSQDISSEEEFLALREIFMAPLPTGPNAEEEQPEGFPLEEEMGNEEEEAPAQKADWEQEFNFTQYLMNYAKPEIMKAYVILAADFEQNSAHTNHCVTKMLHRIGFDLGFVGLLFQASLFRVFQKLMLGPSARSARFQELFKLGVHVVRKFSEVADKNKKVFMELLFWKGSKEAMQITEGYDYNPGNAKVAWTEAEENELIRLFEDFRDADTPGKDAVDLIMGQWSGADKTRVQFIRHLKNLNLIESVKDLKKITESTRVWTEDDERELELVYNENKDSDDPLSSIIAALSKKRSRNKVSDKLLALGLATDRKQLYKKRQRKPDGRRSRKKRGSDSDDDNSDTGSDDGDDEREDRRREVADSSDDGAGGSLPSDEEILSSPSASDASSDDDEEGGGDNCDDDADEEKMLKEQQNASLSSTDLVEVIRNIVEKGYKDQVGWIHRILMQNANSREGKDKLFSVPIVPLTEENENAMEDPVFIDFMQGLGLSPPANEQEVFWRIPAVLAAADLRAIAMGIELDDDGHPLNPDALTSIPRPKPNTSASSAKKKKKKDNKKEKRKKMMKKKKRKRDSEADNDDKENKRRDKRKRKEEEEKKERRKRKEKKKKRGYDDGEDGGENVSHSDVDERDIVGNRNNDSSDGDDGGDSGSKEGVGRGKDSNKMASSARRREALKAMLNRRKVKKGVNHSGESAAEDVDETDGTAQIVPSGMENEVTSPPQSDVDNTQSEAARKSKKRVQRVMNSDSDSDNEAGKLVIDQDKGSSRASPAKPAKRIRLLDSDLSDSDAGGKEKNMDVSTVTFGSDDDVGTGSQSHSQSQSQGLLDFGDSDDEGKHEMDDKNKKDDDESSDDDVPLTGLVKKKGAAPESFPATMLSQGPPDSDGSELDDHVPLTTLKKGCSKIISDDEDE